MDKETVIGEHITLEGDSTTTIPILHIEEIELEETKKYCYICKNECSFFYAKDTPSGPLCIPCHDAG